jgi:hypothetical protein
MVFKSDDAIFMAGGSGIANLIGIPLLLRTSGSYQRPGSIFVEKLGADVNPMATLLKRDILSARKEASLATAPSNSVMVASSQERMTVAGSSTKLDRLLRSEGLPAASTAFSNSAPPHEPLAGFGSSPTPWDKDKVGSVCVVRADSWPLAPEHLEAICEYIKQKVEPVLLSATAGIDTATPVPGYEDILNSINKNAFLEFFNEYKASKAMTNPIWRDMLDPYVKIEISQQALADRYKTQNVAE